MQIKTGRSSAMTAAMATALSLGVGANAAVVAQWDFNAETLDPSAGANAGSAVIGTIGGVVGNSFASGAGSSDPFQPGSGWQTSGYPGQGSPHGFSGIEFKVSTQGYDNIGVSWDLRGSNTSSAWSMLMVSVDGGLSFVDSGTFHMTAGSQWFTFGADLSTIAGAADNVEVIFRVVSVHGPMGVGFEPAQPGSNYSGGTWRFDMVTISGDAMVIPAPGAMALFGLAGLTAAGRRRRA